MAKAYNRNMADELIRVISIVFVIMIHTGAKPWEDKTVLNAVITNIIFLCNSFFFMLSGKYNLSKKFTDIDDYIVFYIKRFRDIVFPYVLISLALSGIDVVTKGTGDIVADNAFVGYLKYTFVHIFSTNSETYLWFMYVLIGLIFSAPFLSKMLNSMNKNEIKILVICMLVWNTVKVFVFSNMNWGFSYSGWIFDGWIVHFVMGYCLYRLLENGEKYKKTIVILAGVTSVLALSVNAAFMAIFSERYLFAKDLEPLFIIGSAGAFIFLENVLSVKNDIAISVISFITSHGLTIYLVHYYVAKRLTKKIVHGLEGGMKYCLSVMITFCISLAVAVIIDSILGVIKRCVSVEKRN